KIAEQIRGISDFAEGQPRRAEEQRAIGGITEPAAERAHRGNLGLAEAAAAATAAEAMLRAAGKVDIRFAADDEMAAGELIIISPIDTAHEPLRGLGLFPQGRRVEAVRRPARVGVRADIAQIDADIGAG